MSGGIIMSSNSVTNDSLPSIDSNRIDIIVAGLKSIAGPIPIVGSLVSEAIGSLIPNQRMDRIARYVSILEQKIASLEKDQIVSRFSNPGFIDLFEDSLLQAIRALTNERLQHIAVIVRNGISDEQQEYERHKLFLRLLGELNDIEVIILQSYLYDTLGGENEFHRKHNGVLRAGSAHLGSSQEEWDISTVHKGYKQHLVQLDLLSPKFKKPKKNELPTFDESTGMIESSGYKLTSLGRLLLRNLDISEE